MKCPLTVPVSLAVCLVLITFPRLATAQTAPCRVLHGGMNIAVGTMTLDACARTIQASQGLGSWGGQRVNTDGQGGVYVNGQFVGRAMNPSGTYGSLRDRCLRGDVAACDQFGAQSDSYGRQYQQMYPKGWNR
jgi:hypothetical protein